MHPTVALAVAAGLANAVLFASPVLMGPSALMAWCVSPMPLILAGLALGRLGGGIAAGVGLVTVLLVGGSGLYAATYAVSDLLPALLIVGLALRPYPGVTAPDPRRAEDWYPPGAILARLALAPLPILAALTLVDAGDAGDLRDLVRATVEGVMSAQAPGSPFATMDPAIRAQWVDAMVRWFPGVIAQVWLLRAVGSALLAHRLARSLVGYVGRTVRAMAPVLMALTLPSWYVALLLGVTGLALVTGGSVGYIAESAAVFLVVPVLLLGLKLVHAGARTTPRPVWLLSPFYIVLVFVSGLGYVALALAGLVEFSLSLRRRAAGRASEEE
ncbi:hypothetical protein F1188_01365 [Roseospira marina]|uniref:DUF2232 domain-containing protein n=1 Tax=Roseospira marina TaxID=140057 RepID=A0A5M6IGK8_9PROT|nr:hypothetical protein [Roseospira marina]KAA5607441.1 hypothetical protein F1188_01365 [Roseospira marina]MBB4312381.1 hypothetical protein [Roseospira marina]MBB5085603.1 hypothetical protein [Roseospira marina]